MSGDWYSAGISSVVELVVLLVIKMSEGVVFILLFFVGLRLITIAVGENVTVSFIVGGRHSSSMQALFSPGFSL